MKGMFVYRKNESRERLLMNHFKQWKSLLAKSVNNVAKYPESGL